MSDIARLGFEIDSTQARSAATDLAKLNAAAVAASGGADKLNKTLRDTQGRFKSSYDVAKQYGSEVRSLADKYNPVLSAVYKYQAAQEELNRAVALGVVTQGQADATLERLAAQYNSTANASQTMASGMVRTGGAADKFGKSMAASSQHTTNLMFQFQDIGMMLAAGQNPLMLAMQQGTQVSGVFHQMEQSGQSAFQGIKGGLLALINPTSLLTLGVIAGGAALVQWGMSAMGASEEARTLDDAMGDVSTAISDYSGYIATASMTTAELTEKFGAFSGEMREFSVFMAGITLGDALTAFNEQSTMLKDGLTGIEQGLANVAMAQEQLNSISKDQNPELWLAARDALELFQGNLDEAATKLGILPSQAQGLADVLSGIKSDGSMSDLANSSAAALRYISSITPNAMSIKGPLGDAYRAMYKVHENAKQAAKSTQELAGSAPGADWMNPAIGGVDALIGRVEAALGRVAALRSAAMSGLAAQYQQYGEGRVAGESLSRESGELYGGTGNVLSDTGWYDTGSGGGSGGGGGGGGTDPYADNLTRLIESLQTEKDTVDTWYSESMSLLEDRRALEILGAQGHADALLSIEEELHRRKTEIRDGDLAHYESFFGSMTSALQSGGSKMLAISKGFALAEAAVSIWRGAAKALELPFPASLAAWGQVIATGAKALSGIKSASFGGGSVSGGASATTSATSGARAEPERVTRVELMGEDWMVSLAESMMTQIYDASKNGRVIVARA